MCYLIDNWLLIPDGSWLTWCARHIKSMSCFARNLETISGPKVNDTPLSFSPQPITSLSGSDQRRSQSRPTMGGWVRVYMCTCDECVYGCVMSNVHVYMYVCTCFCVRGYERENRLYVGMSGHMYILYIYIMGDDMCCHRLATVYKYLSATGWV